MPEEKKSRYTEAQKRATEKYKQKNYKRIPLDVQLSKYEEIKAAAEAVNESVNGFIKVAIDNRIEGIKESQAEQNG